MTTMTDAELNRALAEKLEPLPPREKLDEDFLLADTDACGVTYGRSPMKLWYAYEGGAQPEDFHTDPSAMVALIKPMEGKGWFLHVDLCARIVGFQRMSSTVYMDNSHSSVVKLPQLWTIEDFIRAVRDAAAKAFELI